MRRFEWIMRCVFAVVCSVVFWVGFHLTIQFSEGAMTNFQKEAAALAPNEIATLRFEVSSYLTACVTAIAVMMLFVVMLTHNIIVRLVLRKAMAGVHDANAVGSLGSEVETE